MSEKMGGKALGCCSFGRQQNRREGENFGVENEERESVLPNKDFLPIFTLLYLTSYNDIMPSAPLKSFLYITTLLL